MKRVTITSLDGRKFAAELEDPTSWIADCISHNYWGFAQRTKWKEDCSALELTQVLSEEEVTAFPGVTKTQVTLKVQYTIEIADMQAELDAAAAKRAQIANFKQAIRTTLQKADVDVTTAEVKSILLKFLRASLLQGNLD